jgi:signal transduction histidine kinase
MPKDEKRHAIVMLRWVLMIALSYVVVFGGGVRMEVAAAWAAFCLGSNLVLMRLPVRLFDHQAFDFVLATVDLAGITFGLWLCGSAGPDFFFLFFFAIFLAAVGERPELTALAASFAASAYLLFLYPGSTWSSALLLRVPFLFVAALMYGYLATRAREARSRARAAEHALGSISQGMRTPLSGIIHYAEVLRSDRVSNLTPEQHAVLAEINSQAIQMLELIVSRLAGVLGGKPADRPEPAYVDPRLRLGSGEEGREFGVN